MVSKQQLLLSGIMLFGFIIGALFGWFFIASTLEQCEASIESYENWINSYCQEDDILKGNYGGDEFWINLSLN